MPAAKTTAKTTAKKTPRTTAKKKAAETETNPLQAPFFDALGERNGEVELPKAIFDEKPNMSVMHQAFLRQMANARQGTASTKTRGEVSGGGAKPYRQKGTGRARHGSIREPSMKGGGVVFGPHPRDYSKRMPKQMRRLALRSALSQKAIDGQVRVIESFVLADASGHRDHGVGPVLQRRGTACTFRVPSGVGCQDQVKRADLGTDESIQIR